MKKALVFKNFIGEKPKFKISDYLYNRYLDKFSQEESKALKLENTKRKEIMKSISRQELKDFALKYDTKKGIYIKRKNSFKNLNFDIDVGVDCPEELHFFLINIFQKGNKLNFERNKTIK